SLRQIESVSALWVTTVSVYYKNLRFLTAGTTVLSIHSLKKRDLQNWVKAKLNPTVARPAPQRRVVKHYGDFILMNTSERLHSTLLHIRRHISPQMMIVRAGLT